MAEKLKPIELGESRIIGEKEFELTPDGGLAMQVAWAVRETYNVGALLAKKAQLKNELGEIDALLAKHAELIK